MLKSGKLCNQSCFKTSLLPGTTAIRGGSEIYIPPVQGVRGRKVPLMRSISLQSPAQQPLKTSTIHIHYCVPTTTENLLTPWRTRAKLWYFPFASPASLKASIIQNSVDAFKHRVEGGLRAAEAINAKHKP
ncbi:hypothetical protein HMPREF9554_01429 [Treponema phagedenis F0421]|uniref:hypothetical protein n=1 Tax=Treponema phagedenis TaxID=162 RepID=UPI0001F63C15|nr:hypothetical protein [Treponema phagedenis]EFW38072.1 hypothetical protein HMPREF9554_01429 [Treponema phagedenis F0421]